MGWRSGVVMYGWYASQVVKGTVLLCKRLEPRRWGKNEPQEGRDGAGDERPVAQPLCDI